MRKEKVFSKFNTRIYNDKLEEILERKPYSENAKNNILNMIYKIEEAYDDYKLVKVEVENKKNFLEKILKAIDEECYLFRIINTKDINGKNHIINYDKGEIEVLPNHVSILYAIFKLARKNKKYKRETDITKRKPIFDFLNIGYNINQIEVIRDFNGWAWINSLEEVSNINANIVYQNLQLLLGNKFMEELINNIMPRKKEFIVELEAEIQKKYGIEVAKQIINLLNEIAIIEISNIDEEYKEILLEIKRRKQDELYIMLNKKEFLKEISEIKKNNLNKIKEIDKIISDRELLQKEYRYRNSMLKNDDKIFSVSYLVEILNDERNEILEKIKEVNKLMEPKNYLAKKEELENIIAGINVEHEKLKEKIIELQKIFIKCYLKEIKYASDKTEIIKILYKIRYYLNISFEDNKYINNVEELEEIGSLKSEIINKLLKNKVIFEFSDNIEINKKILNKILDTRIINLQNISILLEKKDNSLNIKIYDEDELVETKNIEVGILKDKYLKLDKKIKIFV